MNGLLRHFEQAHQTDDPTPAQAAARAWLPEAMLFPAIDLDATAQDAADNDAGPADDNAGIEGEAA